MLCMSRGYDELSGQALDAMPQQVAVIDAEGIINLVNKAWVDFACTNGIAGATKETFLGSNYLATLENVTGDDEDAKAARLSLEGIRAVLQGHEPHFSLEYPCHSPHHQRWFIMNVSYLPDACAVVVHTNITERKLLERRLKNLAYYDTLTGLASRTFFDNHAVQMLALAGRHKRTMHVLYLDLDGFKEVNDIYGHAAGDYLLIKVAERLRQRVRKSDLLCRIGGDEFVLLVEDDMTAQFIGERFHRIFDEPFTVQGKATYMGASIGVAEFPLEGECIRDLMRIADARMYRAKAQGGGVIVGNTPAKDFVT